MTAPAKTTPSMEGLERVLIGGDLGALSETQRAQYYSKVCESVGLNPLTQPFEYLKLNGRTVLYAKRACTDQLRNIHRISVTIVSREKMDDIYVVTARATTADGRTDESIGAVPLKGLSGENLANALMKGETKAKRRVTLGICGLSLLDETEVESIQQKREPAPARSLDDVARGGEREERPFPLSAASTADSFGGKGPVTSAAAQAPSEIEYDGATGEVLKQAEEAGFKVVSVTKAPVPPGADEPVFGFGKHAKSRPTDVEAGYLRWLLKQPNYDRIPVEVRAWVEYANEKHEWERGEST